MEPADPDAIGDSTIDPARVRAIKTLAEVGATPRGIRRQKPLLAAIEEAFRPRKLTTAQKASLFLRVTKEVLHLARGIVLAAEGRKRLTPSEAEAAHVAAAASDKTTAAVIPVVGISLPPYHHAVALSG